MCAAETRRKSRHHMECGLRYGSLLFRAKMCALFCGFFLFEASGNKAKEIVKAHALSIRSKSTNKYRRYTNCRQFPFHSGDASHQTNSCVKVHPCIDEIYRNQPIDTARQLFFQPSLLWTFRLMRPIQPKSHMSHFRAMSLMISLFLPSPQFNGAQRRSAHSNMSHDRDAIYNKKPI